MSYTQLVLLNLSVTFISIGFSRVCLSYTNVIIFVCFGLSKSSLSAAALHGFEESFARLCVLLLLFLVSCQVRPSCT